MMIRNMIRSLGKTVELVLKLGVAIPIFLVIFALIWLILTLLWMTIFAVIGVYNLGPDVGNYLSAILGFIGTFCVAYYKFTDKMEE